MTEIQNGDLVELKPQGLLYSQKAGIVTGVYGGTVAVRLEQGGFSHWPEGKVRVIAEHD